MSVRDATDERPAHRALSFGRLRRRDHTAVRSRRTSIGGAGAGPDGRRGGDAAAGRQLSPRSRFALRGARCGSHVRPRRRDGRRRRVSSRRDGPATRWRASRTGVAVGLQVDRSLHGPGASGAWSAYHRPLAAETVRGGASPQGASLAVAGTTFLVLDPHVMHRNPAETLSGLLSHSTRYGAEEALESARSRASTSDAASGLPRSIHAADRVRVVRFRVAAVGLGLAFRRHPFRTPVRRRAFLALLYGAAVGPTRMPLRPLLHARPADARGARGGRADPGRRPGRRARIAGRRARAPPILLFGIAAAATVRPAVRSSKPTSDSRVRTRGRSRRSGSVPTPRPKRPSCRSSATRGSTRSRRKASPLCRAVLPAVLRAPVATLPAITVADWPRWTGAVARGRPGWGAVAERALLDYWNMPGVTPAHGDYVAYGQPLLELREAVDDPGSDPARRGVLRRGRPLRSGHPELRRGLRPLRSVLSALRWFRGDRTPRTRGRRVPESLPEGAVRPLLGRRRGCGNARKILGIDREHPIACSAACHFDPATSSLQDHLVAAERCRNQDR